MVNGLHQTDFDSLHCIYCKLQIGVQFDPLTATKTFVHLPGHINNVARLKTCRFNQYGTIPEQSIAIMPSTLSLADLPPLGKRELHVKTTIQNWHCCLCHICWHGEKTCPQCEAWVYTVEV